MLTHTTNIMEHVNHVTVHALLAQALVLMSVYTVTMIES